MQWIKDAIWWHVYPLGFTGAPVRPASDNERKPTPRLRQLIAWLDYAVELGTNGLLLGPIFTSTSHGYDTLDFFTIDPRLGDEADFDALVTACQERGIHLVLDGVFNHVGEHHPLYRVALEQGPESEAARLFQIDWTLTPPQPLAFEGHGSLVTLDHSQEATSQLVEAVMRHWLSRGIAGWRLDAAYAVPAAFWSSILTNIRSEFPQAWFVGEMIHGDYGEYVETSGLDSITQYELWKATWSSLADENFYELDWTLTRHNQWLEQFIPHTFVGNHDVTRIVTLVGRDKLPLALTVLFTVAGIPSIYYGDEQGFDATKWEREGGDDDVRPAFPAVPGELSPLGADVRAMHQELVGLRRRNPWLVTARTEVLELRNGFLKYRSRGDQGQSLIVTLDLEGEQPRADVADESPLKG